MGYPADREAKVLASAPEQLPTLKLADGVSAAVAAAISQVSLPCGEEPPPRLQALWFMAILCLRSLRAATWVVRIGYEDQAVGYVRVVDELCNRSEKVCADESGQYARQWLADKGPGKPAKLTDKEFWDLTSGPPHGTVRAIQDWLAISGEGGSTQITVGPELLPPRANATLAHLSYQAAAVGWRLSAAADLEMNWNEVHAATVQARDKYLEKDDARASTGPGGADRPPSD